MTVRLRDGGTAGAVAEPEDERDGLGGARTSLAWGGVGLYAAAQGEEAE